MSTDDCVRLDGNLPVVARSDGCFLDDSADNTIFRKDPGGIALKIELHYGGGLVAKEEFHPYGEVLWVYDTRNDGDGVTTWLSANNNTWFGPYEAPGTDAVIDYRRIDLDLAEGASICVDVKDEGYYIMDLCSGLA